MKRLPRISDAEWLVMKVSWSAPGRTAAGVVEALQGKVTWNARTIRTLINPLLRKKALTYDKEGRKYRYFPAVIEAQCVRQETRSFLRRVCGTASWIGWDIDRLWRVRPSDNPKSNSAWRREHVPGPD